MILIFVNSSDGDWVDVYAEYARGIVHKIYGGHSIRGYDLFYGTTGSYIIGHVLNGAISVEIDPMYYDHDLAWSQAKLGCSETGGVEDPLDVLLTMGAIKERPELDTQ